MVLTQEQIGKIAMQALQYKLESEGIHLRPKEVKLEVLSEAERLGIPTQEMAAFVKLVIETAYEKTITELNSIIEAK